MKKYIMPISQVYELKLRNAILDTSLNDQEGGPMESKGDSGDWEDDDDLDGGSAIW